VGLTPSHCVPTAKAPAPFATNLGNIALCPLGGACMPDALVSPTPQPLPRCRLGLGVCLDACLAMFLDPEATPDLACGATGLCVGCGNPLLPLLASGLCDPPKPICL
jgi:hypothetical protein